VITKYAFATRVGFIPNNPNKVNQDSFILSPNLGGCNFRHYFGVCDGHGQNGKEASHFIKMRLPQLLSKNIDDHLAAGNSHGQTKLTPCHEDYKSIFHRSFITCNEELDC
jgi:serine/threonine protein phosphatase PrpC